jgi:hypothetical protein
MTAITVLDVDIVGVAVMDKYLGTSAMLNPSTPFVQPVKAMLPEVVNALGTIY